MLVEELVQQARLRQEAGSIGEVGDVHPQEVVYLVRDRHHVDLLQMLDEIVDQSIRGGRHSEVVHMHHGKETVSATSQPEEARVGGTAVVAPRQEMRTDVLVERRW